MTLRYFRRRFWTYCVVALMTGSCGSVTYAGSVKEVKQSRRTNHVARKWVGSSKESAGDAKQEIKAGISQIDATEDISIAPDSSPSALPTVPAERGTGTRRWGSRFTEMLGVTSNGISFANAFQPEGDAPLSDAPLSDAPMSDAPMSDAPMSDSPAAEAPTVNLSEYAPGPSAGIPGVTTATDITAPAEDISTQNLSIPTLPTSTAELTEASSSVNVRRTSPINLDLRMRGYTSHQLVGTYGGVNQMKARIDIDSLFSAIDPGIVQNMRVINGPYTSLYGPGFGFFVADPIDTKRTQSGTDFGGSLFLDQGTNGQPFYNRDSLWAAGQNWGVYFSYGLRFANDYAPGGNGPDFRVPSSYQLWNTFFAFGLDLTRHSRLETTYLRNEINGLELAGVVYDLNNVNSDQFNVRYIVQDDRESPQKFLMQYWNTRDDYNGNALKTGKQQTFYRRFITDNYSGTGDPFDLVNTQVVGGLETQGLRSLLTLGETDYVQFTMGADWRRYQQYHTETHFAQVQPGGPYIPATPFGVSPYGIPTSAFEDYGLFSELFVPISEDLRSTIGGRLDWTQASLTANIPGQAFAGDVGLTQQFPGTTQPDEVLGMAYLTNELRLTETIYFDSGVAYGMRNPTLSELYSDSVFVPIARYGNSIAIGNSQLRPEKNLQFDLGFSQRGKLLNGGIRSFYSNIDDYILYDLVDVGGQRPGVDAGDLTASRVYAYRNLNRASLYGGDAFAEVNVSEGSAIFGTVTYVRGINHDPQPQIVGLFPKTADSLPGIYPLNGTLGFRFFDKDRSRDQWGFTILTRMVAGQDQVASSLFEQRTPGWVTLDLLGYWRVNDHVRLTGAILNATDRLYSQHGSLLLVDRNNNPSFVKDPGINARFGLEISY